MTITTVSCDGSEAGPCIDSASSSYDVIPSIALRLARREGWKIDGTILCRRCDLAQSEPAPAPAALPVMPERRLALVQKLVDEIQVDFPVPLPVGEPSVQLFGNDRGCGSMKQCAA